MRRLCFFLLLCTVSFAASDAAFAGTVDPPGYSEAVSLGLTEFEEKNFAEARTHFAHAHALSPSARTFRALGMVAFELKHYAESALLLEEALASHEKPLDSDKRAHAQQLLARAKGYLGKLVLDLEPHTTVAVDSVATPPGPGGEIVLEVGDHLVEFQAPERIGLKRSVTIRGGEQLALRIRLANLQSPVEALGSARERRDQASSSVAASPPENAGEPKKRSVVKSPWLWTAVGVVLAGAAAGAAVALTWHAPKTSEPYYSGTGGAPVLAAPP